MAHPYNFYGASSLYLPTLSSARYRYEAARSFDLDDDLEFCPELLSEDEMHYINTTSSYSDRSSSSSSGSPNSSPLQMQIQPSNSSPSYSPPGFIPSSASPNSNVKMQQSSTARARNAIPIVNPHTGMRVSSPPLLSANSRAAAHSGQIQRRHW